MSEISYKYLMVVRVYKFGGASLSDINKIKFIAHYLKSEKQIEDTPIIVVVSAMGKTTDDFIHLAQSITPKPKRRELDMLLTSGERISMALLSLALNELGVPAISLTGSQAGIITDSSHGNARILATRPVRLEQHLYNGEVVVLAGFQGVSEKEKEVTTLGRGGSDTTAVAMAAHFKSLTCDFKKDVGGIFSADPKIIPQAQHIPQISFKNLMDMTFWGSKVLHYRAVELAYRLDIPLRVSHFEQPNKKTIVHEGKIMIEEQKVLSINSHSSVQRLIFAQQDQAKILQFVFNYYKKLELPYPQILSVQTLDTKTCIYLVSEGSKTDFLAMGATSSEELSSVTMTSYGSVASDLLPKAMKEIENYPIYQTLQDSTNITFVIQPKDKNEIVKKLHALI